MKSLTSDMSALTVQAEQINHYATGLEPVGPRFRPWSTHLTNWKDFFVDLRCNHKSEPWLDRPFYPVVGCSQVTQTSSKRSICSASKPWCSRQYCNAFTRSAKLTRQRYFSTKIQLLPSARFAGIRNPHLFLILDLGPYNLSLWNAPCFPVTKKWPLHHHPNATASQSHQRLSSFPATQQRSL